MTALEIRILRVLVMFFTPQNHVAIARRLHEVYGDIYPYTEVTQALIGLRDKKLVFRFRTSGRRRTVLNKITEEGRRKLAENEAEAS